MIRLNNVVKGFDKFKLEDISIEIPKGYICGMVGQNGAGKTTILNLILGIYKPDAGSIEIFRKEFSQNRQEILDNVGTVLVEDYFEEEFSLKENFEFFGKYYTRFNQNKLNELLDRFNLTKYEKQKYKKLSKGEKLKVQFAFALSHEPKLLVLDEPTANFDPEFRKEFFECLTGFMADGERSVVLATHLTEDLDRMADYLIYVENGRIRFNGDIEYFHDNYKIVHGEKYKINLLPKENIIFVEESEYDTKALVKHDRFNKYSEGLQVISPSIGEFMYGFSKREGYR